MNANGNEAWSGYMLNIYRGRKGVEPLGTVVFDEIEAKAKEKLKDYPGEKARIVSMRSR
jgi:hypothetical protein